MTTTLSSTPSGLSDQERELEAFATLQRKLPGIWRSIRERPDFDHTSVVLPSLSVDQSELNKIDGAAFYEERLLFSLIRLRHPRARVLYVTSQPVHPEIVDYYLSLLVGVPSGHARRRFGQLCVYDASAEPLTSKILRRPRVLQRIRNWVGDLDRAYVTCFIAGPLERRLAVTLGLPLNGVDPALSHWGTKSGSRKVFAAAGVPHPRGSDDLDSRDGIVAALDALARERAGIRQAMVKLNDGFSGEGNAVVTFPAALPAEPARRRAALDRALDGMQRNAADETLARFLARFEETGGIVEERLEAPEVRSPSVQLRVTPLGDLTVISTHEQVLGGAARQSFIGCRFPADADYRATIVAEALKVGEVLREKGVRSRFSVDFVATRAPGEDWRCHAIEINLRMGGTTHPFLALEFLTGGALDPEDGLFYSPRGDPKAYFATDNLKSAAYRGLLPEDLMDILVRHGLHFQPARETGVLFHMIGALSQFGKLGVTCIGDSAAEADEIYRRTVEVLDRETGAAGGEGGRPRRLLDHRVPSME